MGYSHNPVGFSGTRCYDGRPRKDFIPYTEARNWVSRLGFENYKQWLRFSKMRYKTGPLKYRLIKPSFIPVHPSTSYRVRGEWESDSDFLGHHKYWKYDSAKKFALSLQLNSSYEWRAWHKENNPIDIPRYPELVYNDWTLWSQFIGSKHIHHSKKNPYAIYDEAIKLVHGMRLQSVDEYRLWVKEHPQFNLPTFPEVYYKEWEGWIKFLGKSIIDRIEIEQSIDTSVLYVARRPRTPSNVYEIVIEKRGRLGVDARQAALKFQVVKVYAISQNEVETAKRIILANGSSWWELDDNYIIGNIHELLFQLDVLLFTV